MILTPSHNDLQQFALRCLTRHIIRYTFTPLNSLLELITPTEAVFSRALGRLKTGNSASSHNSSHRSLSHRDDKIGRAPLSNKLL
jgi:hypothetical protein